MKKALFISVLVATVLVLLLLIVLTIITPFATLDVEAHVKVDDYVGINLDRDKLYFGTVSPGNTGRRDFQLTTQKDAFIVIKTTGPLADWMTPDKNAFPLAEGEHVDVLFTMRIPDETAFGNYTSSVTVLFYRPAAKLFYG